MVRWWRLRFNNKEFFAGWFWNDNKIYLPIDPQAFTRRKQKTFQQCANGRDLPMAAWPKTFSPAKRDLTQMEVFFFLQKRQLLMMTSSANAPLLRRSLRLYVNSCASISVARQRQQQQQQSLQEERFLMFCRGAAAFACLVCVCAHRRLTNLIFVFSRWSDDMEINITWEIELLSGASEREMSI